MSEMDIDKATTLIPVCTGAKNLSEFINTCDIAVKSVDKNNLPLLIKIINSKLAGNALEATKYRDTEKWEDIKSILKGAFKHRASERTLTIGLNFARMEENESVTSFASRVEELYYNLCTECSKDMSGEESRVYKKQLKNQALIIFGNGLLKHLNLALKARDPKTLETAMQFAKDEEMEHNANLQMEKLTKNIKNQNLNGNNNTSGNNVNQNNNNQNFNREIIEREKTHWRNVLKRIIAAIHYLAKHNEAFRGTSDVIFTKNNGKFLGLIEMIGKFDPVMGEHLNKIKNHDTRVHYLGHD
ncbi:hypothetical protein QTP88_029005 [Uroleucon formosanum]